MRITIRKPKPGYNWPALRAEYIAGGVSLRGLARKHSMPVGTVTKRAGKEGWTRLRADAEIKSRAKVIQETADATAILAGKLVRAQGLAVDITTSALEQMASWHGGNHVKTQTADTKGRPVWMEFDLAECVKTLEAVQRMIDGKRDENDRQPVQIIIGHFDDDEGKKGPRTVADYLRTPEGRAKFPALAQDVEQYEFPEYEL